MLFDSKEPRKPLNTKKISLCRPFTYGKALAHVSLIKYSLICVCIFKNVADL